MMKSIIRLLVKLNLLKNREKKGAQFVLAKNPNTIRLKYLKNFFLVSIFIKWRLSIIRWWNTLFSKPSLFLKKVDWKKVKKESGLWLISVLIEGGTANFATHYLFNVPLNPMTLIAHGIVIKQGVEIYWRLRKNG